MNIRLFQVFIAIITIFSGLMTLNGAQSKSKPTATRMAVLVRKQQEAQAKKMALLAKMAKRKKEMDAARRLAAAKKKAATRSATRKKPALPAKRALNKPAVPVQPAVGTKKPRYIVRRSAPGRAPLKPAIKPQNKAAIEKNNAKKNNRIPVAPLRVAAVRNVRKPAIPVVQPIKKPVVPAPKKLPVVKKPVVAPPTLRAQAKPEPRPQPMAQPKPAVHVYLPVPKPIAPEQPKPQQPPVHAHEHGEEPQCAVCLEKASRFKPEESATTKCCKHFICKADAELLEQRAQEEYGNLRNPELRRQMAAQPDFAGWPENEREHAACPYCQKYPLEVTGGAAQAVPKPQAQECCVCFGESRERLSCGHTPCKGCLTGILDNALQEKNSSLVRCPDPECRKPLLEDEVRTLSIGDRAKFTAYTDLLDREWLVKQQHLKQCPTADCKYAFFNEEQRVVEFTCPECTKKYCSQCLIPHVGARTCQQAATDRALAGNKDASAKATHAWMHHNAKKCPQCKVISVKTEGCDRIVCTQCQYSYCWVCLGHHDYSVNHQFTPQHLEAVHAEEVVHAAAERARQKPHAYIYAWHWSIPHEATIRFAGTGAIGYAFLLDFDRAVRAAIPQKYRQNKYHARIFLEDNGRGFCLITVHRAMTRALFQQILDRVNAQFQGGNQA